MKATNIILQGLPADIYSHVNHHRVAKYLWESVQLLMLCTSLTKQERVFKDFAIPPTLITSSYLEQHDSHANEVHDPIACLNKAMAFLTAVASSRVTGANKLGRKGQNYSGTTYKNNATLSRGNTTSGQPRVVKCYNCQGEGHMARQCTQPKRPRNVAWYKENAMLAEAQEDGQILDEEQLTFLADPRILADQAQKIIPHNAAFQTEDPDTYDLDCDDLSTAQAVLMANISNYGSDIISEVVQIVLWYLDSGCSKHMTGNRSQLMNFVSTFWVLLDSGTTRLQDYGVCDYHWNVIISDTFYNSLSYNDQDSLNSAAGGNFLYKSPTEGLQIIENKAKGSALEDNMTLTFRNEMNNMMKALVTTPAPIKAVEERCTICGSNHSSNVCPMSRGGYESPVYHDNFQQFQQTASVGNFVQHGNAGYRPPNLANHTHPLVFLQTKVNHPIKGISLIKEWYLERISKKRTKNKAKTTKPDSEWKRL
ncbi:retrovirus-related pol polyprotein from transposon TNT 1-94 [Tanacetum coccineum]